MRVLKWVVERCRGRVDAEETALGWVPNPKTFDLTGMPKSAPEQFNRAQALDAEEWKREIIMQEELFMKLYSHLPKELIFQRGLLMARL